MTQILKGRFDGSKAANRRQGLPPESLRERYAIDAQGRRILVGLTAAETSEFEALDSMSPSDGERVGWTFGGEPTTGREKRWLELYTRHGEAWKTLKGDGAAPPRSRLQLAQQPSLSGPTRAKPPASS